MIAHILFEGSSTAAGYGDESERMGYAGRAAYYYRKHNLQVVHNPDIPRNFVYTHLHGQPDNYLPQFVDTLPQHIAEARWSVKSGDDIRMVGVFAIGGFLAGYVSRYGEEETLLYWRRSLRQLEQVCREGPRDIEPIVLALPTPGPNARLANGKEPDFEFRNKLARLALESTDNWATYVDLDDIVGNDRARYIAKDDMHPTAAGYDEVSRHLIVLIDDKLGLEPLAREREDALLGRDGAFAI
ncbi:MAG: SGNH/GDSL hydrolase family protein [Patescibacteria group bacterium]